MTAVGEAYRRPRAPGDDIDRGIGSKFRVRVAGGAQNAVGIARGVDPQWPVGRHRHQA